MARREDNRPTVPEQELYPEIAAVPKPGEHVCETVSRRQQHHRRVTLTQRCSALPIRSTVFPWKCPPSGMSLSRQWWLTGHGLHLEIQGIALADSPTLQETIDRVVQSLQPR